MTKRIPKRIACGKAWKALPCGLYTAHEIAEEANKLFFDGEFVCFSQDAVNAIMMLGLEFQGDYKTGEYGFKRKAYKK